MTIVEITMETPEAMAVERAGNSTPQLSASFKPRSTEVDAEPSTR
jgi:hypothetical protein